ncbi:ABC transporter [Collinsella sp. An307]|nr:ABC transporter [Collinsella sp. An307]
MDMQTDTAQTAPRPAIALRNVCFSYPGAPAPEEGTACVGNCAEALAGVTLTIAPGEHVCVLGANGSGKSTLIQLINGLLTPTEGTVEVLGQPVTNAHDAAAVRRRCAMVFQRPEDQMVTSIVADDVAFGPENLGVPAAEIADRVDRALAAVRMSAYAQADPTDLSGGQRQRVAIAGALAMEPEILLLDEPGAFLDDAGKQDVRRIIEDLRGQGITIVHVTHDMEDALAADRVVVLDRGLIARNGTPAEVFAEGGTLRHLGLELPFAAALAEELGRRSPVFAGLPHTADTEELARAVAERMHASPRQNAAPEQPGASPRNSAPATAGSPAAGSNATDAAAVRLSHVSFSYAADRPTRRRRGLIRRRDAAQAELPLALSDVSFAVPTGSLTALIGRTGAGKSTTVELVCALKYPLTGSVAVGGIDTADRARRRLLRAQIGYASQFPARQLFAETVFDDVAFGPRNLGLTEDEVRARVHDALALVGLEPAPALLARSPFTLSGGQQRSVALAGVLALKTPVLVLDEPMAGLDPRGQARMRVLIERLRAHGTTLLMVTHNMDDVAELADRVVVLEGGRVVANGTPREVFSSGAAPGTPAALALSRTLAAHGVRLPEYPLTGTDLARALIEEMDRGTSR